MEYFVVERLAPPWRWGIFYRKPCRRLDLARCSPHYVPMTAIYGALKEMGFRETYWQIVYPGQIGGLIKNPRQGLLEFHIRFFEDGMLYAELELGRSVLIHFLNHRYYLNRYLSGSLASKLSPEHMVYLNTSIDRYKSRNQRNWPEWGVKNRFMTPAVKRAIRTLSILTDWRTLALIMLISIAIIYSDGPPSIAYLAGLMIIVYVLAPKRS